ncbi:MAG TPA: hypothetical protein VIC08_08220 [Cellvibrionaceae bacterium]
MKRIALATVCLLFFGQYCLAEADMDVDADKEEVIEEVKDVFADDPSCEIQDLRQTISKRFRGSRVDSSDITALIGLTIANIHTIQVDVFDETNPDENNSIYRFLNRLHINTKDYVVINQLLFAEGEPVDASRIYETERLLRTRGYLTGAFIVPEVICDEQVGLAVVTRDSWSLDVEVSFSHGGGDTSSGFGISDDNLLGTGIGLSIGYEQDAERNGIRYTFATDHLLNTRLATHLSYADTSDGKNIIANLEQPFYSRLAPWAAGISYSDVTEAKIIRASDEVINEFRHENLWQEVYYGRAVHISKIATQRVLVGYTEEQDRFSANENTQLGFPPDRKASYPWVEYQYLEDRYTTYRNLNQIQRTEDVPLGITFSMRVGYGKAGPSYHGDVLRYIGSYQHIFNIKDDNLLSVNVGVNGRDHSDSNSNDSAIWSSQVAYNYMVTPKHRWYTSLRYAAGQDLEQYEELTVGGINGMRGYPTDFQRGNKRAIATIERRYYSDWHWFNLVRVGAVAFVEVGKAWDGPTTENSPTLANVGFGLRLSSSKVRVGNIVHVDIAAPLVEQSGIEDYQLLIKAYQTF